MRREPDGGRAGDPFDRWVDRQLQCLYGPVADEPIPPRLRALLERAGRAVDDTTDGGGADDGARKGEDGDGAGDGHDERGA
ncbi:MAG: NepR family anti-sigma factor [Alphaproteobacteria bacterium]